MCFVLLKYLDEETYNQIILYLTENFQFLPKIIHSDFEISLAIAIKKNIHFKKVIHSRCLFHYSQMIRNKLKKIYNKNKKLNRISIEILRNLELLCFISVKKIQAFKEIILKKIDEFEGLNEFKNYLKNYIFKLDNSIYNYDKLQLRKYLKS